MRKYLPFILFLVALVVAVLIPVQKTVKIILAVVILLGFSFYRRNVFYFLHANSLMRTGKLASAWKWYDRALKAGIASDGRLSIASIYVQYGDEKKGEEILKAFKEHPGKDVSPNVSSLADMLLALIAYQKDKAEGIRMMERIKEGGFSSTTLAVDLITMYLDVGDTDKADGIWNEYKDQRGKDVGLDDCLGRILIVKGKWDEAYALYTSLITQQVRIVNEFVHTAQACIHYGKVKEAIACLEVALRCTFNNINTFTKENVAYLHDKLKDPVTRMAMAKAIDRNPALVASGAPLLLSENNEASTDADLLEGFAVLKEKTVRAEKQERTPDTDLDASDEQYLEKHNL